MCNRYKILIRNESELVFRISDFCMKIGPHENQDVARQILFLETRIHLFESKWTLESGTWYVFLQNFSLVLGTSLIFSESPFGSPFYQKDWQSRGVRRRGGGGYRCPPVFRRSVKPILTRPWGLVNYAYQIFITITTAPHQIIAFFETALHTY